jgi:hypothetical protein
MVHDQKDLSKDSDPQEESRSGDCGQKVRKLLQEDPTITQMLSNGQRQRKKRLGRIEWGRCKGAALVWDRRRPRATFAAAASTAYLVQGHVGPLFLQFSRLPDRLKYSIESTSLSIFVHERWLRLEDG